jgi:hypothetical protein
VDGLIDERWSKGTAREPDSLRGAGVDLQRSERYPQRRLGTATAGLEKLMALGVLSEAAGRYAAERARGVPRGGRTCWRGVAVAQPASAAAELGWMRLSDLDPRVSWLPFEMRG